mmetsp:Transcript_12261/g.14804  ORF Transcript_12261/g.14804 Transcript_12261/m.14804 type:complete len:253 (+) Transcript_12261:55-813(+)
MASLSSVKGKAKAGKGAAASDLNIVTKIRNVSDMDLLRASVKDIIRDGNISKKKDLVQTKQKCNHDYYLRDRPPSGKLEVDHTFECQLLTLSLINTKDVHQILAAINVNNSRTNQLDVVQNFMTPIYQIHNDTESSLNLKLLDEQLNILKGKAVTNWIKDAKKGANNEESYARHLESIFTKSKVESVSKLGAKGCGTLANKFVKELSSIEQPYTSSVENANINANVQDKKKARTQFESVAEEVKAIFEALDI